MRHDLLTNLLAAVYLYFECMMIGTITANAIAARYVPKKDKDFIIPGCATRKDGTPTPLLRGRLDLPPDFAEAQRAETEKAPVFVLSGGKDADECISEKDTAHHMGLRMIIGTAKNVQYTSVLKLNNLVLRV